MSSIQEKRDQFQWWLTCIPDKVETLHDELPSQISSKLDYTLDSLQMLENYLIQNYTVDIIMKRKDLWDALASYVGTSFRRLIANSEWYIELDNEHDIFYNKPVLITKNSLFPPISPHSSITTLLDRKKGTHLTKTVLNRNMQEGA